MTPTRAPARYDSDLIIDAVTSHFGLTRAELVARDRRRCVCAPRQIAMLLLRRAGYSLPAIGRMLDRDHTTVLNGIRQGMGHARLDPQFRSDVEVIKAIVKGETWAAQHAAEREV